MAILGEILVSSIVLLFFSCVSAGHGHHGGGHSNIFRKQHTGWDHANYEFAYDIHDPWHNKNFRKERGHFTKKGGHVEGSYGIHDSKGRLRIVKYTAGKGGFVASIKTNEPGTSNEDAAGAFYNGKDHDHGKWLYDVKTHHDSWGKKDHWGGHHDDHHGKHHSKHKHHGYYAAAASEPFGSNNKELAQEEETSSFKKTGKKSAERLVPLINTPEIGTRQILLIEPRPAANSEYKRVAQYLPQIHDGDDFNEYIIL